MNVEFPKIDQIQNLHEGGLGVCGTAGLTIFLCGIAVFSKKYCGIAGFANPAVCGISLLELRYYGKNVLKLR